MGSLRHGSASLGAHFSRVRQPNPEGSRRLPALLLEAVRNAAAGADTRVTRLRRPPRTRAERCSCRVAARRSCGCRTGGVPVCRGGRAGGGHFGAGGAACGGDRSPWVGVGCVACAHSRPCCSACWRAHVAHEPAHIWQCRTALDDYKSCCRQRRARRRCEALPPDRGPRPLGTAYASRIRARTASTWLGSQPTPPASNSIRWPRRSSPGVSSELCHTNTERNASESM